MAAEYGAQELGRRLVDWFRVHKRDLPWRVDRDPYRVWVSEIMLQQTRADTVAARYESFLRRFPTLRDLAAASEEDVLKEWEGLGYYARARHLRLAAREVVQRYGGRLPSDPDELARLPGIGPYTAAAIASIAFNRPAPAVDGNVLRVVARLYGIEEPVTQSSVKRRIEKLTAAMIPPGQPGDFTEALMELGALVCTPGEPDCTRCPWADACVARERGTAAVLPNRPRRRPTRVVHGAVAVCVWQDAADGGGRVLVVQRPDDGLLAGMWEFPWTEVPEEASDEESARRVAEVLRGVYGVDAERVGRLPDVKHVFSHLQWRLRAFVYRVVELDAASGDEGGAETRLWADARQLGELPFGRAHRRIAQAWRRVAGRLS